MNSNAMGKCLLFRHQYIFLTVCNYYLVFSVSSISTLSLQGARSIDTLIKLLLLFIIIKSKNAVCNPMETRGDPRPDCEGYLGLQRLSMSEVYTFEFLSRNTTQGKPGKMLRIICDVLGL